MNGECVMANLIYSLEDNSVGRDELSEREVMCLRDFAGIPLKDLCDNSRHQLLIFPHCLGGNGDEIEKAPLFSLTGGHISAGNVVGFWGVNGVNVRVHSRFDRDDRQFFLHYMLQRVNGVSVLNLSTLPEEDKRWDFSVYLFPMILKRAISQGIFKTYRRFSYDDDRIHGAIDIASFVSHDIPFRGSFSYSAREYTGNNSVLQLVRYTIEFIRRRVPVLLQSDLEMRNAVNVIVAQTPNYTDNTLAKVVAANLRPIHHPFYTSYRELQKICLWILRHEKVSYGSDDGSICGIVFDISWVWEEFLNKVMQEGLKEGVLRHPQNKKRKSADQIIHIYEGWNGGNSKRKPIYPDFLWNRDSSKSSAQEWEVVLDAKYKRSFTEDGGGGSFSRCARGSVSDDQLLAFDESRARGFHLPIVS